MSNSKKSNKKPVSKVVKNPKKPAKKPAKKPVKKKVSRPQTAPVKDEAPVLEPSKDLVTKWAPVVDPSTPASSVDVDVDFDDEIPEFPTTTWGRVKLSIMDFFKTVFK